ncbi:trimeric intracellular cation channel family protein [Nitrosophilus alvini]|uniref:trimeric intracellular cation channel family protein n=1 Tax=Nitrosophilus alvini TaxID=2714855 RepID=UPI00190CEE9B|nr:trimeric intracellular cation channel family protein [Nitrosophilus alvini]
MNALEIAEIIGIGAFALSGFWVAVQERLDLLGIFVSAFLTALGGGIVRDILSSRELYSFTHYLPVLIVIAALIIASTLKLYAKNEIQNHKFFIISDSIGLSSFAISGALAGIEVGFNFFGVILLSLITAVGGGVMRDILLNRIPLILLSEFYGSVAILIGTVVFLLDIFNQTSLLALLTVFVFGFILRLVAYYRNWHLPKVR